MAFGFERNGNSVALKGLERSLVATKRLFPSSLLASKELLLLYSNDLSSYYARENI